MNPKIGVTFRNNTATIVTYKGEVIAYRIDFPKKGPPSIEKYLPAKSTASDSDEHRLYVEVMLQLAYGSPDEELTFDTSGFYGADGLQITWVHPMYLFCLVVADVAGEDGNVWEATATRKQWLEAWERVKSEITKPHYATKTFAINKVCKVATGIWGDLSAYVETTGNVY